MELIDGKVISEIKRTEIKEKVLRVKQMTGKVPGLATILVGKNAASQVYIKSKIRACKIAGMESFHYELNEGSPEKEIIDLIKDLNNNARVDGILLQLPLPENKDAQKYISVINPLKDVDGLHPFNVGGLSLSKNWVEIIGKKILVSCTPLGIVHLLHKSNVKIEGAVVVIVGRSNLVGKPLSMLLLANDATVVVAHSGTKNLKEICKLAEILVVAVGKPNFINKSFIKNGATVIDVGINRTAKGLCGDVDFDSVKNMDIKITPVPGGVGPMTISMLLENSLRAFNNRKNLI
jgi:methylenetetrahydrofolate dehydrogenase (NADP+)/methenyltetrahydrofolate cyclohydrolase